MTAGVCVCVGGGGGGRQIGVRRMRAGVCVRRGGGGKTDWSQKDESRCVCVGGGGRGGGGQKCKITNMSHHRIHVHNI